MGIVTGRRHIAIVRGPRDGVAEVQGVWDGAEDDKTTVCAMPFDDDVVSSAEPTPSGVISGVTGTSEHLYEDSLDDRLPRFAVGTGDRTFEHPPRPVTAPPVEHPHAVPPPAPTYTTHTGPFALPAAGPYPSTPWGNAPTPYGAPVPYGPMSYGATGPFVPVPAAGGALRWIVIGAALTFVGVLGIAMGKLLFTGRGATAPAPVAAAAAASPAPASDPAPAAAAVPPPAAPTATTPAATPTPAAASEVPVAAATDALNLEVASLGNPGTEAVVSPLAGTITRRFLDGPRAVRKGEKLFEVTRKLPAGPNHKALAAKVAELEKMADQDPVYKPFLARARRDYQRSQPRAETAVVKAAKNGMLQPAVGKGDRVDADQGLAMTVDSRRWVARAALAGSEEPDESWACAIVVAGGEGGAEQRAPCKVDEVIDGEVAVVIDARKASWLRAEGQRQQIQLSRAASP